jgi:hemerythrin-like domain-containing protein
MSVKDPLVRSKQLTPLSHEHYEGLLFVWRIRQGLKRNASIRTINDFINWFWKNHLQSHFEDEEKNLVPYLPVNDELSKRMMREHEAIRKLLPVNRNLTFADINSFAGLLHDHIRFEERELFPHIEKELSLTQLNDIFDKIDHESSCSTEWKDEFWKG